MLPRRTLQWRRRAQVHTPIVSIAIDEPRRAAPGPAVQVVLHHRGEERCLHRITHPTTKSTLRLCQAQYARRVRGGKVLEDLLEDSRMARGRGERVRKRTIGQVGEMNG